ncbi:hypothetical protein NN561_003495 [Cricetulus griseus]
MKQVPNPLPKVLSRRGVGAGMEAAERESFERTQVRTSNPGASLGHPEWCRVLRGFEGTSCFSAAPAVGLRLSRRALSDEKGCRKREVWLNLENDPGGLEERGGVEGGGCRLGQELRALGERENPAKDLEAAGPRGWGSRFPASPAARAAPSRAPFPKLVNLRGGGGRAALQEGSCCCPFGAPSSHRAGDLRGRFVGWETVSVNKAINTQEVAVKEKHARNILLDAILGRLALEGGQIVGTEVLKDSLRYKNELSDMSRMWNPRFPGNLQMSDRQLDEAGESDVNNFFQLTVEMFDFLECELNLFQTVFNSLDMSRSVSVTTAGQCRLAPLIQVILDCSHLYDYTVKLLFKLHSCLPADTLQGHRDRFMEQFTKLKDLFQRSSNLQYFKRLIQIPQLPENPPNFLRASALSEHISPVVVIPAEVSSPDSEPVLEKDDLMDMDAAQQNLFDNKFDDIFGSSLSSDPFNFNNQNGVNKDEKDHLIERLYREISGLTGQLDSVKMESQRAMLQLKGRVSELEAELAEQQHLGRQATDDCEFLRTELDELKRQREDTEKAQRSLTEIERKAQANEQRYSKLKEKYSELVQNHADLLRKNAEVTKQVSVARQAQVDLEREKKELEDSFARVSDQAQRKTQEQQDVLENLKHELASSRQELQVLHSSLETSAQSEAKWLTQIAELEKEQGSLVTAAAQREEEFSALRDQLESTKIKLASAQASNRHPPGRRGCQRQMCHEGLKAIGPDGQGFLWTQFLKPSASLDKHDHLLSKVKAVSSCLEQLEKSCSQYLACPEDISELLHSITLLANLTSDTIIQGSATSLRAPPEPADSLTEACRQYGKETLAYLFSLEEEEAMEKADSTAMKNCLRKIEAIGEVWDAADLVVQGKGKFEELMVCSHEIAASTAQLVAASKVKANKGSLNLTQLQQASRGVNQATAAVVASTISGKSQIEETDSMDFSSMTLTQIKRQEMDSQVRVLELENDLQKERQKLGELRKKHYELAGVAEGWEEGTEASPPTAQEAIPEKE